MEKTEIPVSDEDLSVWYDKAYAALNLLTKIPTTTADLQLFYPHGEAIQNARTELRKALDTLRPELERRNLLSPVVSPYGLEAD